MGDVCVVADPVEMGGAQQGAVDAVQRFVGACVHDDVHLAASGGCVAVVGASSGFVGDVAPELAASVAVDDVLDDGAVGEALAHFVDAADELGVAHDASSQVT